MIQLHHGDCIEVMQAIPDGAADMILCDLPYGTTACHWDSIIPFAPLWEQYRRVIKCNGAIVLFGSQPFTTDLIQSNRAWFKYCWVWEKTLATDFLNGKNKPLKAHEDIIVFSEGTTANCSPNLMPYYPQVDFSMGGWRKKQYPRGDSSCFGVRPSTSKTYTAESDGRLPKSIITFSNANHGSLHPTQKPVALLEYLIRTYTNPGEVVLGNCMGSGSTLVACINTGRAGIGIERDDAYFAIAQDRIAKAQRTYTPPLFTESEQQAEAQAATPTLF
jgi:site-specific DNA-methyltransferase (adenine-specific)